MKLCVIPARGGNRRIPRTNIREVCAKPMIARSIEAAQASAGFGQIIVSTDDAEIAEVKNYPIIDFSQMLEINYPEPKFLLDPLIRDKTVTQISGDYGSGKTHIGLKTAIDISQGFSFLPEESIVSRSFVDSYTWYRHTGKTKPILYVEGELPAADLRDRVNSLIEPFIERHKPVDLQKMFFCMCSKDLFGVLCLHLPVWCLELSVRCLELSVGCLELSLGCLELSLGCDDADEDMSAT